MADDVKVVVKVRPLVAREQDDGARELWATDSHRIWPKDSPKDCYAFDAVFNPKCTTKDVYEEVAKSIVRAALNGINGTIFAYGQTSSGKTYTMMGDKNSPGIVQYAVDHIFQSINEATDTVFLLRISFIEIYNEKLKDLFDLSNSELKIQERNGCWQVTNCREFVVDAPEQIISYFEKGIKNRSVGETLMNERSSRSHTIFKIIIESRKHIVPGSEEEGCVIFSQLNLVDLAGSERASQTGATKERLREGGHINKSLVTLCRVIRQLSDCQGDPNRFINYRDSKLTHILQSSLGGNAKTGIICAVTPATFEETHSTLKFATCAKVVVNKPIVNSIISDAQQRKLLTDELESLKRELENKKLVEENNILLQEKISILNAQINLLFGKTNKNEQYNKNRRRTWGGFYLQPIEENSQLHLEDKNEMKFEPKPSIEKQPVFNYEQNAFNSKRTSYSKETLQNIVDDIICLDSDDEKFCNSPNHKCYNEKTPPCVMRERVKYVYKELRELEEMTTLECVYRSSETDFINQMDDLKEEFSNKLNEATLTSETYKNEILELKKILNSTTQLKQTNIDLEYELQTCKANHHRRENELISRLTEMESRVVERNKLNLSHDKEIVIVNNSDKKINDMIDNSTNALENKVSLKDIISEKTMENISLQNMLSDLEKKYDMLLSHSKKEIVVNEDINCQLSTDNSFISESEFSELKMENENLKQELRETRQEIEKLLIESEELEDKISLNADKFVASAELSLLSSNLAAADHYHTSLHNTCDSTLKYLYRQLLSLQLFLQNQNQSDITFQLEASYNNLFSTICDQSTIHDKSTCDKQILDLNTDTKDEIVKPESKTIEDLETKIKKLERENADLSDEIMEYIQEIEKLQQNTARLEEYKIENEKYESVIKEKDIEINELNKKIYEIPSICDDQMKYTEHMQEIERLQQSIAELNDYKIKNEIHVQEIEQLQQNTAKLDEYKIENEKYESVIKEKEIEINELNKIIDEISNVCGDQMKCTEYIQEIERLQQNIVELNEYKIKNQTYVQEIEKLQPSTKMLDELKMENEKHLCVIASNVLEIDNLYKKMDELSNTYQYRIRCLDNEINNMKNNMHRMEELDTLKKENEDYRIIISSKNAEIESVHEKMNDMCDKYNKEIKDLLNAAENAENMKKTLMEELHGLEDENNKKETKIELKDKEIVVLSQNISEISQKYEEQVENLKEQVRNTEESKQYYMKELNDLKSLMSSNETIVLSKENIISAKETELNALYKQMEVMSQKYNDEIKNLKQEIVSTEEAKQYYSKQLNDLQSTISSNETVVLAKEKIISAKETQIDSLCKQICEMSEMHNNEILCLKGEINSIEQTKQYCLKELSELKSLISTNDIIIMTKENIISEKEAELDNLYRKINEISEQHNDQVATLNSRVNALEKIKECLSNELAEFRNEKETFNRIISQKENDIHTLHQRIKEMSNAYNHQIKALENEISNSKIDLCTVKEIDELKIQNEEFKTTLSMKETEVKSLFEQINKMSKEYNERVASLEGEVVSSENEKRELSEVLDKLRSENETVVNKKCVEINSLSQKLSKLYHEYKQQMKDLKILIIAKENIISTKNFEVDTLYKKIDEMSSANNRQIKSFEDEINLLERTNRCLMKELDEFKNKNEKYKSKILSEETDTKSNGIVLQTLFNIFREDECNEMDKLKQLERLVSNAKRIKSEHEQLLISNHMYEKQIKLLQKELDDIKPSLNKMKILEFMEKSTLKCDLDKKQEEYNKLLSEYNSIKTNFEEMKVEFQEIKDDSCQKEQRKKRQSIIDLNRGCLNKSAEDFAESQNKENSVESASKMASNILHESNSKAVNHASGSGIVLNQRLCEYMMENDRLVKIVNKLKQACLTRKVRIRELEGMLQSKN